ncbi:MAG: HAMP domain-containing protein [Nitrospirota bacterium]|nr:HAMP domain-containing protein [Nitrospirota bacterium]
MKEAIYSKLEAVRDLKVNELNKWLDERTSDIKTISANETIRGLGITYTAGRNEQVKVVRDILKRHVKNYEAFDEISIISPGDNKVLVSSDASIEGKPYSRNGFAVSSSVMRGLFIGDLQQAEDDASPSMLLSYPVYSLDGSREAFGVLVIRINLELTLYKLLLNRTGLGRSGETLIVNNDVVALNELRWHKDAPLKFKLTTSPTIKAAAGRTGIEEAISYSGQEVLSAYTYIPRTGWGFVAKQEVREIYAPIVRLRNWMLLAGIITTIGAIFMAFKISRSVSRPVEELYRGINIIGSGNLDYRVSSDKPDEIGRLSRAFDSMIDNIKNITASRDELNMEIAERKLLEKKLLEAEERERERIGRDLHDDLGQLFTGLAFKCLGLKNRLEASSGQEAGDAAEIMSIADNAKVRLRHLVRGLVPVDTGREGLQAALAELARNITMMSDVSCEFSSREQLSLNDKTVVLNLYRIAQEAVSNAVRHAGAGHVDISLDKEGDRGILVVADDGRGIDDAPGRQDGMGIRTMRYRANLIGAELDIRRGSHGGTVVACSFVDKIASDSEAGHTVPDRQ